MNLRLFLWSLTAALAGFLFGFDTVVISGAEQTIQQLWNLDDFAHGLAMSAALWGTVLGSLAGGWVTDRLGRRRTLLGVGVLYFVSAVWSGLAGDPAGFMIARLLGGLGVGVSTVAAPLYISEIAPPAARGRLAGLFQFNIVFGILVAFASNAGLKALGEAGTVAEPWRWMLGVEAAPAVVYALACLTLPESPRWLLTGRGGLSGDGAAARAALRTVRPDATDEQVDAEAAEIEAAAADDARAADANFFTARLRTPILLAFLIAMFNQLSGINAVLYFAPRIFEAAGLGERSALLQSVGIGVTNLVFTFVGLWLIDRLGRRTLLLVGSVGYVASLGACSWAFFSGNLSLVPACVFTFIAAHAVGQGAVIWVFIAEIFPNRVRARGQALGSFTHWFFAAALTFAFPVLAARLHPGAIFAFFCGMMALQLLWVLLAVPETKGRSLEAIERDLGLREPA